MSNEPNNEPKNETSNETNKPNGAQELTDKELEGVTGGFCPPSPSLFFD